MSWVKLVGFKGENKKEKIDKMGDRQAAGLAASNQDLIVKSQQ